MRELKTNKKVGLLLLTLVLSLSMAFALAACGNKNDPTPSPAPSASVSSTVTGTPAPSTSTTTQPTTLPTGETGAEAGVYYYAAENGEEYLLSFTSGLRFTLTMKDEAEAGTYTLSDDGALTLSGKTAYTGSWKAGSVTLNLSGAELRFLKKEYFTLTFNANGGSDVAATTVLSGKSAAKPADPEKAGYAFLGWYKDEALTAPYAFDAEVVSGNLTLFARWAEKPANAREYEISFDLGFDGEAPAAMTTIGGKLYNAPEVTRAGYDFVGWFVSTENAADRLSYAYVEPSAREAGTTFDADTTLFAVWAAENDTNAAPALSVSSTLLSWNSKGSAGYLVKVTDPDGNVVVDNQRTASTVFPVAFDKAGAYIAEVTAVDAGGNAVSETAVRYFVNKALARVSGLKVAEPSTLVYESVENAEKYYITVECGDPNHNHTKVDNGSSLYFNFANCEMKKGGIRFTVTAAAKGYASSTVSYTFERTLDAVSAVTVKDDELTWTAVENAGYYLVTAGEKTFRVSENSLSLKTFAAGSLTLSVTPVTKGYVSPAATEVVYEKTTPALPANLRLVGTTLSFDKVEGATGYVLTVAGQKIELGADETSVDLAGKAEFADAEDYVVTLTVLSGENSAEYATVFRYGALDGELTYKDGVLSWKAVLGAVKYEIMIEGEVVGTVESGENFFAIDSLKVAGDNKISVRFTDGKFTSEWAETSVYAHEVLLDSRGGSETANLYKAAGDPMVLPVPEKLGYTFLDWYNAPKGPESNGAKYTDEAFTDAGDLTLYAYYASNAYTLTYNVNGATETSDNIYFGKDYELTVPASSDPTQVFGGWFTAPYGGGILYASADGKSVAPWSEANNDVVLYAYFVDAVLRYVPVADGYAVTKGDRISVVSKLTVPATYNGQKVVEVMASAFENAENLTEINLPSSLLRIATTSAFSGCTNLSAINIYKVEGSAYARYTAEEGVLFDNGESGSTHAPRPAFMPAAKTGAYTVPDGVDAIPYGSFRNSSLTKVVIPASVASIESEAFFGSKNLTTVVFSLPAAGEKVNSLTIGDRAFANCIELASIQLPARLSSVSLGKYTVSAGAVSTTDVSDAFLGCSALIDIEVAKNNKEYASANGAILSDGGTTLCYFPSALLQENFVIPDGVTKIAAGAFAGCERLSGSLTLPGRIADIGEYAFYGANELKSLTFEEGALNTVSIGKYAFAESGVTSLTFAENSRVKTIGEGAFENVAITELTVPASVTVIENRAFAGSGDLTVEILEGTNALTIKDNVFDGRSIDTLTLPKNVTAMPDFIKGLTVKNIIVAEGNPSFVTLDGVLYTKKANTENDPDILLFYPAGKTDESFVIPDGVTAIGANAFKGQENLTEITIPSSVVSIGEYAFYWSGWSGGLSTLNFAAADTAKLDDGSNKLTIGDYAFYGTQIQELVLPLRTATVGAYAFSESKITSLSLGGTEVLKDHAFASAGNYKDFSVEIPASLTEIGDYAFSDTYVANITYATGCTLKTIGAFAFTNCSSLSAFTVPASVEVIGAKAFCNSSLSSIVFEEGIAPLAFGVKGTEVVIDSWYDTVNYYDAFGQVLNDTSVTAVNFPGRLTELCESAFEGNSSITSVTFGKVEGNEATKNFETAKLTTIGKKAFYDAGGLTAITIPASVKNTDDKMAIGDEAFRGTSENLVVTFVMGGDKDTAPLTIGAYAFASTHTITNFVLPARLAYFTDEDGNVIAPLANGLGVFSYNLEAVTIQGEGASDYVSFDSAVYSTGYEELLLVPKEKAGTLNVPAATAKIGDGALSECSAITEVAFAKDSKLTEIGAQAFYKAKGITELTLPDGVNVIGKNAFELSGLTALTLSRAMESFDPSIVTDCTALRNLNVAEGNPYLSSIDGVLFSADKKELIYYLSTRTDTAYEIPEGTEIIRESAFMKTYALQEVTVPASVTLIGEYAFNACNGLKTAHFTAGNNPLVFGESSFAGTALTTLDLPARTASIGDEAFAETNFSTVSFADGVRLDRIGNEAFRDSSLTEFTLPKSVRELGDNVFKGASSLEAVTLSEGLTKMGDSVFSGCWSLETIYLPSTLKTIGENTFSGCSSLKNVRFAANSVIEVLPRTTFVGCTSLEIIELPASLTEITGRDEEASSGSPSLFSSCTSLKRVTFAEGSKCVRIGLSAFEGTSLEEFTIPASVTTVENRAFAYTELTSIIIPNTVMSVGSEAFYGCLSLEIVQLGTGLSEIVDYTFMNCSMIERMTIPANIVKIGLNAFNGCSNLKLELEAGNPALLAKDGVIFTKNYEVIFFPAGKSTFTIPKDMTTLPDNFAIDHGITSMTVEEGNASFVEEDGIVYTADKSKVVFLPPTLTSFVISKDMTSTSLIDLLKTCKDLASVEVEEGNTAFVAYGGALYDNEWNLLLIPAAMETYVIPAEVTTLPENVFSSTKIKTITGADRTSDLELDTMQGRGVFANMTSLTSITLPEHTTLLGYYAFANCSNLQTVNLPSTLTTIDQANNARYSPFYNCSSLKEINVAEGNTAYVSFDGVLYSSSWTVMTFPVAKTSLVIPHNLTELGNRKVSTAVMKKLETITYEKDADGKEVTNTKALTLYSSGFSNITTLKSVELPSRVSKLTTSMFNGCSNLESLTIADGGTNFRTEGKVTYKAIDGGWATFFVPQKSGLTEYTVPTDFTVTTIGQGTFSGVTTLEKVTLSDTVTTIEAEAFKGCTGVSKIFIPASVTSLKSEAFGEWTTAQTVYVTFASEDERPSGWYEYWMYDGMTVSYGATQESFAAAE